MNQEIRHLLFTPDSTDGGGGPPEPTFGSGGDGTTTAEAFMAQLEAGALSVDAPESKPMEQLVNPDGTLPTPAKSDAPIIQMRPADAQVQTQAKPSPAKPAAPQAPRAPSQQARDLTGFTPEEAALLKQMSQPAYEFAVNRIKAHKEATAKLEELTGKLTAAEQAQNKWLFEHEEAYTLSPEYREQSNALRSLNMEYNHWQTQLARAEAGQNVFDLVEVNGKVQVGQQGIEPTPEIKAVILANMQAAGIARQAATDKLQAWRGQHQQRFQQFRGKIANLPKELFRGEIPEPVQAQITAVLKKQFPPELHGDPMSQTLATAFVMVNGLLSEVASLKQQLASRGALQAAESGQGPGGDVDSASPAKAGAGTRTALAELEALQAQLS